MKIIRQSGIEKTVIKIGNIRFGRGFEGALVNRWKRFQVLDRFFYGKLWQKPIHRFNNIEDFQSLSVRLNGGKLKENKDL